uniref:Actin interacting protein 3-like C-terminal domain-containing protein n=1 Tax=Photinus pyralis TaxID=7054 RepID=A0A1Y1K8Q5_PHOPY
MESMDVEQKQSSPGLIEKATANTNQENVIKNNTSFIKSSDGYTNNFAANVQNSSNLKRNNSAKSRINKSLYLQLHRQASHPCTSTVDKLKGRYEATDNAKANLVTDYTANRTITTENVNTSQILAKVEEPSRNSVQPSATVEEPRITPAELEGPSPEQALSKTKSNIEKLQKSLASKLSNNTIQHLRNKYSPASFGYPKSSLRTNTPKKVQFSENLSKIPLPTPRVSILSKEQAPPKTSGKEIIHSVIVKEVSISPVESKQEFANVKDENSNVVGAQTVPVETKPVPPEEFVEIPGVELEVQYDNIKFAEPEDKHFIVRRCSSEDSIEKLESFLSDFVMDKKTKERKRSNSFRRLLTGGLFGKDKKKSEDNRPKNQKKDNAVFSDNAQNESQVFDRNATHRNTMDSSGTRREPPQRLEEKPPSGPLYYYPSSKSYRRSEERDAYTDMSSSGSFMSNRPPKYSPEHYLPMNNGSTDKPLSYNGVNRYLDTSSSSSNTIDFDNRNCTYQNALIAQAEMRQIRENQSRLQHNISKKNVSDNGSDTSGKSSDSPERFRESPLHTSKNMQLVKPKAVIPINTDRPLPNPYHFEKIHNTENYENLELSQTLNRNLNLGASKPCPDKSNLYNKDTGGQVVVDEVYGTVFDSISPRSVNEKSSLSPSKLKLPPNREKVELQPRLRSPIPQAKVSTDKIIATELLRSKRSPTPVRELSERYNSPTRPSSYQGPTVYENSFQFPSRISTPVRNKAEYMQLNYEEPPKPPQNYLQAAEWHKTQRELDKSPAIEAPQTVTTDVMVHTNPLESQRYSTPPSPAVRPKNPLHGSSPTKYTPSPNNTTSPLMLQIQRNSPSPTAKQEILQNVEAFYWRELRKLKDKEEQDLFNYRHRQMQVYGYVEDPVLSRRSRSVSPGIQRGRRSLSLPRDGRPTQQPPRPPVHNHEPIPEGRPVIAKRPIPLPTDARPVQRNPNFIRNTFERSTIGPIGLNRPDDFQRHRQTTPIFKRGSLTAPPPESPYQMGKKVSFSSNQNATSWPTKNGFTKSPPTRRLDREMPLEDDVFLPSSPVARVEYVQRSPQYHPDYTDGRGVRQNEPVYGNGSKKITVSNKVCDIYGQIHDSRQRPAESPRDYGWNQDEAPSYGQIRNSGLVYGQLQAPNGYNSVRPNPQQNFVRGSRLTASVNDMYRRYPAENVQYVESRPKGGGVRYFHEQGPQRPLPPVPERHDSRAISVRKLIRGYVPVSDNESGSEAGEVQRILRSGSQQRSYNVIEEEWNSDGKSGRASGNESGGGRGENEGEVKSGRSRSARRDDPRRHTLSGDQHYNMSGQGGPLSRTMDLEGQFPRGYPPSSNAMLFDDDPGIMSEVETSSTGFRRGGKQRSSLPVVRTPSKTLERPLGLVFLQYRNETKRALLPNEITSIDTVKALFVRSFPKQLSMEYLDSPLVKIYIHDSSKDMFYELEDVRSHLREIRDRSVLRLFESTDVSGGLPMGGVGIPGGVGHFEDPSYFSEPEFDSEYQHQHIHKSKGSTGKGAPYYMGSTTSLPRTGPLLRPYSPAVGTLPPDRLKTLPAGNGYMSSPERGSRGYEDPYYSQYTTRSGSITPVIDEEVSDTELLDEQYSLYGVKLPSGGPRGVRSQFPGPAAAPYDTTRANYNRLRVEHMERQLANLTGLVQKALTQTPPSRDFLAPPGRDSYRSDKSVSFEKSVSFSDEPPDMNSPKQHSPQHAGKQKKVFMHV